MIQTIRKANFLFLLLLVLSMGLVATHSTAKEDSNKADKAPEQSMDQKQMEAMELWKEYATPNENHEVLNQLVGQWDHTVRWWMSPDEPPRETTGTSKNKWIMGNRFLKHKAKGEWMGQEFKGLGVTGYDNAKKIYDSMWLDNMGTGIMTSQGTYNAETKELTQTGNFTDPVEGEKKFRAVTKVVNDDQYTYTLYVVTPDNNEFKMMEIIYDRAKEEEKEK